MTETLLSPSNVLLFGRVVADLKIVEPKQTLPSKRKDANVKLATTGPISPLAGTPIVDGIATAANDLVLVKDQELKSENGIYKVVAAAAWTRDVITSDALLADNWLVFVAAGATNINTSWIYFGLKGLELGVDDLEFLANKATDPTHNPFVRPRVKSNDELQEQLAAKGSRFARIYGFSFEGAYYELTRPALFLVHGAGVDASEIPIKPGRSRPARAPGSPSLVGYAAADFQLSDDLKVWSYDKADYTIRMDVESGMFEDILIDPFFGDGGGGVSGARVSGARVSGARVSGARVSGARVSGARLSGGRGDATD